MWENRVSEHHRGKDNLESVSGGREGTLSQRSQSSGYRCEQMCVNLSSKHHIDECGGEQMWRVAAAAVAVAVAVDGRVVSAPVRAVWQEYQVLAPSCLIPPTGCRLI